ncbi:MAG: hypothetical protein ACI32N_06495 [Bulleidia sp.]
MEEAIRNVFSAGFDIRKNVRIGKRKMDYAAFRYDQQGRTLAFSNKAVDTYTTHENAYVFHQELNADTFRKDIDAIVSDIYPTLKMEKDHYETLIDLIIFTPLDNRLMDMIRKYQKTKLLAFGLKGAITSRLIAIDTEKRNIAGSSSAKQLQTKLEGVFLK